MSEKVSVQEFKQVVLPYGEVVYKCQFCSCFFSSLVDVGLHVAVCREKRKRHGFKYGYIGLCYKAKSGRPVSVRNTVSNVLACSGCRYFRSDV